MSLTVQSPIRSTLLYTEILLRRIRCVAAPQYNAFVKTSGVKAATHGAVPCRAVRRRAAHRIRCECERTLKSIAMNCGTAFCSALDNKSGDATVANSSLTSVSVGVVLLCVGT